MAPTTLPQETIDHIISYLDKRSLSTTSLVHRSWTPQSRRHLFDSVSLKAYVASFESFLKFLTKNAAGSRFSPPMGGMIRTLHLSGPTKQDVGPHRLPGKLPIVTVSFVQDLLSVAPGLKNLEFATVQFGDPDIPDRGAEDDPSSTPDLRQLHELESFEATVMWTNRPSLTDLPRILSLFSRIDDLRIFGPFWPSDHPSFGDVAVHPTLLDIPVPAIARVRLSIPSHAPFLLSLIRRGPAAALVQRLDVSCYSSEDIWALGLFLRSVGPRVQHLVLDLTTIYIRHRENRFEHRRGFDVGPCSNLKTLGFRFALSSDRQRSNSERFLDMTNLMGNLPRSLRKIVLIISIPRHDLQFRGAHAMFQQTLDAELQWLRVGLRGRPEINELQVVWVDEGNPTSLHNSPGFAPNMQAEVDSLSVIVREKLAGMVARVIVDAPASEV